MTQTTILPLLKTDPRGSFMRIRNRMVSFALGMLVGLAACADEPMELTDGEFDAIPVSLKSDGGYTECEYAAALEWVNDPATTYDVLRAGGVHSRAAKNIIAERDGPDGLNGTADDTRFETVRDLDAVPWVGPRAFEQIVIHVYQSCLTRHQLDIDVVFSPQPYQSSHLSRTVAAIDSARKTLDIAMYSISDSGIMDALKRAVERGVSVRLLFEAANGDRREPEGSRSAKLEDMGIDARYINKIMHHKFVIIDGPRLDLEHAHSAQLITGSANWSYSGGTKNDENTIFIKGSLELVLRFQKEFNLMWANSRDFVWAEFDPIPWTEVHEADVPDEPGVDIRFTSANFTVGPRARYGPTFSGIRGSNEVSDALVSLIESAQKSIWVASGHIRSKPVSEALMAKAAAHPEMDIRVYLDGQEYLSAAYHDRQLADREVCLVEAGDSEARRSDCMDKGFLYGYALHKAGIDVRFKYYAYRWNYRYAPQMHHKYLIVDGKTLASGSYNLSDNAEHNTLENMVFYRADSFGPLVRAFEGNFENMWVTGEFAGLYGDLVEQIESGEGAFPIVFDSMALDWDQITALKTLIRDACPEINSWQFREYPDRHRTCERE